MLIDSAAGGSGLQAGDEIVSINGEETASRPKNAVSFAIRQAVFTGQIELHVRRYRVPSKQAFQYFVTMFESL